MSEQATAQGPGGITLTLDIGQLLTALGEPTGYDPETDEPYGGTTMRAEIVRQASAAVVKQLEKIVAEEVRDSVRSQVSTIVSEAVAKGIRPVSGWGEPKGDPVPLTELIRQEVQDYLTKPSGGGYSDRSETRLQKFIKEQVGTVLGKELQAEIATAKAQVLTAVRGKATAVFTEVLERAVR